MEELNLVARGMLGCNVAGVDGPHEIPAR